MSTSRVSFLGFSLAAATAALVVGCEASIISTATSTSSDGGADATASGDRTADAAADATGKTRVDAGGGETDVACPGAKEGDPCATEGATCAPSKCTDPCQFCNSMICTKGKWEGMEAFPMPCFPCGGKQCQPTEYCMAFHAGVALADGGSAPVTYSCELLANCGAGCTCATATAKGKGQCDPQSCSASGGGPTVECYGL